MTAEPSYDLTGPVAPAEPVEPVPVVLAAVPESRLDQLLGQYEMAKAEADKAAASLKAITDGIKSEMASAAPGQTDVRVEHPNLSRPLRMTVVDSWRVDAKKLKAEQPVTYVMYAQKSTAYRLAAVNP